MPLCESDMKHLQPYWHAYLTSEGSLCVVDYTDVLRPKEVSINLLNMHFVLDVHESDLMGDIKLQFVPNSNLLVFDTPELPLLIFEIGVDNIELKKMLPKDNHFDGEEPWYALFACSDVSVDGKYVAYMRRMDLLTVVSIPTPDTGKIIMQDTTRSLNEAVFAFSRDPKNPHILALCDMDKIRLLDVRNGDSLRSFTVTFGVASVNFCDGSSSKLYGSSMRSSDCDCTHPWAKEHVSVDTLQYNVFEIDIGAVGVVNIRQHHGPFAGRIYLGDTRYWQAVTCDMQGVVLTNMASNNVFEMGPLPEIMHGNGFIHTLDSSGSMMKPFLRKIAGHTLATKSRSKRCKCEITTATREITGYRMDRDVLCLDSNCKNRGHVWNICAMSVSGNHLLTASFDGMVKVWVRDAANGSLSLVNDFDLLTKTPHNHYLVKHCTGDNFFYTNVREKVIARRLAVMMAVFPKSKNKSALGRLGYDLVKEIAQLVYLHHSASYYDSRAWPDTSHAM